MHPNPTFRQASDADNVAFARERGFGTLVLQHLDGPLLSHVPFVLSDDGAVAELHLVRSNPMVAAAASEASAVLAVTGPDGYISPDWYDLDDQVPTWNYVAVHLRGRLSRRPQAELLPMLDRLSEHFERRLAPKPPWRSAKMTPDVLERMMRAIVPFTFHVDRIDGTWKLGQNKASDTRRAAAGSLSGSDIGLETGALATLMRRAD